MTLCDWVITQPDWQPKPTPKNFIFYHFVQNNEVVKEYVKPGAEADNYLSTGEYGYYTTQDGMAYQHALHNWFVLADKLLARFAIEHNILDVDINLRVAMMKELEAIP